MRVIDTHVHVYPEEVIANADEACAAFFNVDFNTSRTRIETVFDEFLDDGRWPFNDLASSNLIDEFSGQGVNAGHAMDRDNRSAF